METKKKQKERKRNKYIQNTLYGTKCRKSARGVNGERSKN